MGHHILPGNPPVPLILRRSARARRISLRVSATDGRVTLTMPRGCPERVALDFVRDKGAWLRARLAEQSPPCRVTPGGALPVEGQMRRIVCGTGRQTCLSAEDIRLPGTPEQAPARLLAWLKLRARDRLADASDRYAAQLGRRYTRLTLRDPRGRWGSCSARGALMYSWRLIMAPPDVLDYVAAHEVAHLAQMNHSPEFWAEVARLCPDHARSRQWLRRQGSGLHRYVFETAART
mgnify:CR=1 FL=1